MFSIFITMTKENPKSKVISKCPDSFINSIKIY